MYVKQASSPRPGCYCYYCSTGCELFPPLWPLLLLLLPVPDRLLPFSDSRSFVCTQHPHHHFIFDFLARFGLFLFTSKCLWQRLSYLLYAWYSISHATTIVEHGPPAGAGHNNGSSPGPHARWPDIPGVRYPVIFLRIPEKTSHLRTDVAHHFRISIRLFYFLSAPLPGIYRRHV